MKIASIVCAAPPYFGGMAGSADTIGRLLSKNHTVINFTPATLKPWLRYGHGAFMPQLLWRLRSFDYIYLHYPFFGTAEVVWFFKLFFKRTKLIIHYHMDVKNSTFKTKLLSIPSRLIRRSLLRQAQTIVTASLDYIKNSSIKNYYSAHPEKFREIPFGLDLDKFKPKVISRPDDNRIVAKAKEIVHYINDKFIKKNRLNLLFVGGLDRAHYFKGVEILLKSLVVVSNRHWRLEIIGDGDLRPEYEELAKKLRLDDRIKFLGRVAAPELIRAYQNADLFILPSTNNNEAFGIVLIEALGCGVPVIASDLAGVRQVFKDHQEGLLFKPGDIEDLKKKLEFIFNNEELRRVMSLSARRLAEKKYSLTIMAEKLENLFR